MFPLLDNIPSDRFSVVLLSITSCSFQLKRPKLPPGLLVSHNCFVPLSDKSWVTWSCWSMTWSQGRLTWSKGILPSSHYSCFLRALSKQIQPPILVSFLPLLTKLVFWVHGRSLRLSSKVKWGTILLLLLLLLFLLILSPRWSNCPFSPKTIVLAQLRVQHGARNQCVRAEGRPGTAKVSTSPEEKNAHRSSAWKR